MIQTSLLYYFFVYPFLSVAAIASVALCCRRSRIKETCLSLKISSSAKVCDKQMKSKSNISNFKKLVIKPNKNARFCYKE